MNYLRNLIGQVLMGLGSLCIVVPLYSLLHSKFTWRATTVALALGAVFIIGGKILIRPPKLPIRPRYWYAAISGMICSVCMLFSSAGGIYVARTPSDSIPESVLNVMVVLLLIGVVAAIACIGSGVLALTKAGPDRHNEKSLA